MYRMPVPCSMRRLRPLALACVILIPLMAAPALEAQVAGASVKVAVIDVGRLLEESAPGQKALERLKNLQEQKLAEGRAKQQEAQELQDRIAKGRMSLSEEKLAELRKELEDKLIQLQRFQDDADREFQKERRNSLEKIERQVMPLIQEIGDASGYTLIFNKYQSGLVFAQDEVDITDQVLARFNQINE